MMVFSVSLSLFLSLSLSAAPVFALVAQDFARV
jgi:hypothetical protein